MNAQTVTVQRTIKADPETVFSYFTQPDLWLSWQGVTAEIDPRPGGVFRMNVRGDGWASGKFVAVEPYERIVFTWGWEGNESSVPAGSSTVEITLTPVAEDSTLLTLVHRGLPLPMLDAHRDGWTHYLDRLTVRASGGEPGPDPLVILAVPIGRDALIKVVTCACGQQFRGTDSELIAPVQQHGLDVHNMAATPEQVIAMAVPVDAERH
jgi:uncharacterized protein YndB with AHSA1/START domain